MAWTLAAAAVAAAAGLGSAAINSSRGNNQAQQQGNIAGQSLAAAEANRQQQMMIQALINQRSTAGSVDQAGTSLRYDPATNQWMSQLGKLPEQVQTSSDQAAVSRNTTDLRQAQAANEQAALRAVRGEGYADTTRRDLESYRPRGQDEMVGLLGEQATRASNATYRPLVADTLRQFARTGTSAGPVLAEIGKSSAGNLRDSLIDAQLKGTTGVDQVNQGRRAGLMGAAQSGAALATPSFGYSQLNPSTYSSTMAGLLGQRSQTASVAPAYGASAVNSAAKDVQSAYGNVGKAVPDPNVGNDQLASGLNMLKTATGKGGVFGDLIDVYNKNKTGVDPTKNYTFGGTGSLGDFNMYPPSAI